MRVKCLVGAAALLLAASVLSQTESQAETAMIYPELQTYLAERVAEFDEISAERKTQLKKLASFVSGRVKANERARLTFICTHNSRRSHLSQIWAAVAAEHYGISPVETYSGGTEATAFNPRAIACLERAGLKVHKAENGKNPKYEVRFRETDRPLVCFSKVYTESPNPTEDYCAVMTCSQADKGCPLVAGCSLRVALPFDDPKLADGTPDENAIYDERSRQICREMLYLFAHVDRKVGK